MKTLYEAFDHTGTYSQTYDIVSVPTERLPYALFGPNIITHFPLLRTSRENDNFIARKKQFSTFLNETLCTRFSPAQSAIIDKSKYNDHLSDQRAGVEWF